MARVFGYWREQGDGYSAFPSVHEFIGTGDDVPQTALVLLGTAPIVASTSGLSFPCVLCGRIIEDAVCVRGDANWRWLDTLPHYIEAHNVGLPPELITYLVQKAPSQEE